MITFFNSSFSIRSNLTSEFVADSIFGKKPLELAFLWISCLSSAFSASRLCIYFLIMVNFANNSWLSLAACSSICLELFTLLGSTDFLFLFSFKYELLFWSFGNLLGLWKLLLLFGSFWQGLLLLNWLFLQKIFLHLVI